MKIHTGGRGRAFRGLVEPGNLSLPGGRGNRLNDAERIEIMRGRDGGLTAAQIARRIDRHRSTVCREIERNSNLDGDYHALMAHARSAQSIQAQRPSVVRRLMIRCDSVGNRVFGVFGFGELFRELVKLGL